MPIHLRRAILSLLLVGLLPAPVLANGKPIQIILSYQANVSNVDAARSASGIAELVLAEGEARVSAAGLPRLDPPQHYAAWIVNTSTNQAMLLGNFNTPYSTPSTARMDQVLPDAIPDRGWNQFIVTIEESASPQVPANRRTIVGAFPASGTEPVPNVLPNTGGLSPSAANRPDWSLVGGLAALTLVLGCGAGFFLGRRRKPAR